MNTHLWKAVAALMLLVSASTYTLFSQNATVAPPNLVEVELLRALLNEVQLLRRAVIESNQASVRLRLLSDQLMEQRRRVEALTEQSRSLASRIEEAQSDPGSDDKSIAQLQTAISAAPDSTSKARAQEEFDAFVRAVAEKRRLLNEQILADQSRLHKVALELAEAQRDLGVTLHKLDAIETQRAPQRP